LRANGFEEEKKKTDKKGAAITVDCPFETCSRGRLNGSSGFCLTD
jgi:hypothetical protein